MIECVANVSEGRNAAAIQWVVAAIRLGRARILDVHSDAEHNRSVITLAGETGDLEEAAISLASAARDAIDLRRHTGVHPRVGALDVVPFVPLERASMEECIALARVVGSRMAAELGIPVFLYGRAARTPDRAALSSLRRGGVQGLAERMALPEGRPDFGDALHPTAGATAVGARGPLVAYNVCLATRDLGLGRRIARTLRGSAGGLRGVQALAFDLPSRNVVQVSMNLTEPEQTTISTAFRGVLKLAAAAGVAVQSSEIVGLAPRWAVGELDGVSLRLDDELDRHLLEPKLESM